MTNEEKAIRLYPHDTEKECRDEFTRNFRNGIIDLFRKCFVAGCEYNEQEMKHELSFIAGWFEHIAQLADDKKTNTGVVMSDSDAFDEIKSLAERSVSYINSQLLNKR